MAVRCFFLKLSEAQQEYEQEQHIDPASLTEEERRRKIQSVLDYMKSSHKESKDDGEALNPLVPEDDLEVVLAEEKSIPRKQYMADLVAMTSSTGKVSWYLMREQTLVRPISS